jgi:hypothetical protein
MEYASTESPSESEHAAVVYFFRNTFPHFIRCPYCRKHYRRRILRHPPPAYADTKPGDMFLWFVELHDSVNVRLRRETYGIERARADYAKLNWNAKRRIVYEALELFAFEYSLQAEEDDIALAIADTSPRVISSTTITATTTTTDTYVSNNGKLFGGVVDGDDDSNSSRSGGRTFTEAATNQKRWEPHSPVVTSVFLHNPIYMARFGTSLSAAALSAQSMTTAEWFVRYVRPTLVASVARSPSLRSVWTAYFIRRDRVYAAEQEKARVKFELRRRRLVKSQTASAPTSRTSPHSRSVRTNAITTSANTNVLSSTGKYIRISGKSFTTSTIPYPNLNTAAEPESEPEESRYNLSAIAAVVILAAIVTFTTLSYVRRTPSSSSPSSTTTKPKKFYH